MNTVLLQAERDHLVCSNECHLLAEHFNDLLVLVDLVIYPIAARERRQLLGGAALGHGARVTASETLPLPEPPRTALPAAAAVFLERRPRSRGKPVHEQPEMPSTMG